MKKLIKILLILLFTTVFVENVFALEIKTTTSSVYYNKKAETWNIYTGGKKANKVTKKGNKFYFKNKHAFTLNATKILIVDNQAIAVNEERLKYYKLQIINDELYYNLLTPKEAEKYFQGINVVPISEFTKNRIMIKRKPYSSEAYMLVNDTTQSFANYNIFPANMRTNIVRGMFYAKKCGTIKYAQANDLTRRNLSMLINIKREKIE